jgi:hypothetical protein
MHRNSWRLLAALPIGAIAALGFAARAPQKEAAEVRLSIPPVPAELAQRKAGLQSKLQPAARVWAEQQAKTEMQRPSVDVNALEAAIRDRFATSLAGGGAHPGGPVGPGGGMDVDAMVMVVLMETAEDDESDLQSLIQEMQAQKQAKDALRNLQEELNAAVAAPQKGNAGAVCVAPFCRSLPSRLASVNAIGSRLTRPFHLQAPANLTYGQLAALQAQTNQSLDSLNDMSESAQMRLQMLMDQRSKVLQIASNIEKKLSDTSDAIVANMK